MKVIFLSVHSGSHCCCWPCSKQFYFWPPFALWSLDFPSAALSFSPPIALLFLSPTLANLNLKATAPFSTKFPPTFHPFSPLICMHKCNFTCIRNFIYSFFGFTAGNALQVMDANLPQLAPKIPRWDFPIFVF